MVSRACLCLLGLLLAGLAGLPAHAAIGLQILRFEHLGPDQRGLQSLVFEAKQDATGVMWMATGDGLMRYDGRQGKLFGAEPGDPRSLRHPVVRSLLLLPEDRWLVATNQGLDEFDMRTETARPVSLPEDFPAAKPGVRKLEAAGAGRVWVLGNAHLYQYQVAERRLQRVEPAGGDPEGSFTGDGAGGLWFVSGDRLVHVDPQGQVLHRWPFAGRPGRPQGARALLLDPQGRLWVGDDEGVRVVETETGRPLGLPRQLGLPDGTLHALLRDRSGTLWLGYGGAGLWRWPEGAAQAEGFVSHPALRDSLEASSVASLFEDRSGVLWVGHWGGGVSLVDTHSGGFRTYRSVVGEPRSLISDAIMAVQADGPSHAWVATYGRGLDRLDLRDGQAEHIDLTLLPMPYQKALLLQPGRLWVGGDGGLFTLELPSRRVQRLPLPATSGAARSIAALAADPQGRVWVASASGVYRVDGPQQIKRYGPLAEGGLSHEVVDSLLVDRDGRVWAGSKAGLQLYDPQRDAFTQPVVGGGEVGRPQDLAVLALRQTPDGRVWLGTHLGLFELVAAEPGRWKLRPWRGLPGMPKGGIYGLENGPDGALWMASADGLTRLQVATRQLRNYPARQGYFPGEFAQGASAVGPDGQLLYGGRGLLAFHPAALRDNPIPPPVVLADIRVFNRSLLEHPDEASGPSDAASSLAAIGVQGPLALAQGIRLSPRDTMVSFDLRAQHFYSPSLVRYAWKLEGFDTDWIQGRPGEGLATYTNLEAGRFRLWARAANPDGRWGEPQALLQVEVLPPWWRTLWFRALLALVVLGSVALAWQWRIRRLRRSQQRLREEVALRTAEVQAQRQQIATLSEIGRELTTSLDLMTVKQALMGHLSALMPASSFGVGLVRRDAGIVEFEVMVEQGRPYKPYSRSLAAPEQPAARCVLSGEPVWIQRFEHDNRLVDTGQRSREGERLELADGSQPMQARSALYVPLKVKGEVLGVMAALSAEPEAFKATHLDMLQTLGAYAAVALDNAKAYRQLQEAQSQLVEQRKLAAMSHLVAGVAHELNTPLGNALLAATTLRDDGRQLAGRLDQGALRKTELTQFLLALEAGGEVLLRSLESASRLVASFKQLAVDRRTELRRSFELSELASWLSVAHGRQVIEAGHALVLEVPEGLGLDSYPGPLRQVLEQLLENALEHGLAGRRGGRLGLSAAALGADRLRLRFSDDGQGIPAQHLSRVFDPFYTTRFGQGSNGLGLHLCYILVSSLLGGQLTVRSEAGQGTVFEIVLPREAPRG